MVMREPRFEFISLVTPKAGAAKQRDAVHVFLEKAPTTRRSTIATRGIMALWEHLYQRRDKQTLGPGCGKYESPEPLIKRAKEAIAS